jgi:hypothetical protein
MARRDSRSFKRVTRDAARDERKMVRRLPNLVWKDGRWVEVDRCEAFISSGACPMSCDDVQLHNLQQVASTWQGIASVLQPTPTRAQACGLGSSNSACS